MERPSLGVAAVEAGGDFGILVQMDRFLETGVTRRDALGGAVAAGLCLGAGGLFGAEAAAELVAHTTELYVKKGGVIR